MFWHYPIKVWSVLLLLVIVAVKHLLVLVILHASVIYSSLQLTV